MNIDTAAMALPGQLKYRADLGLLFDPSRGTFHRLRNATAKQMVERMFAGQSPAEIVAEIAHMYSVDEQRVHTDFTDLCTVLSGARSRGADHRASLIPVDKRFAEPLAFPLRLEIELTAVCNWNCGFCYNVWKIDPAMSDSEVRRAVRDLPAKHLPVETAKRILDECAAKGCFIIRYSGGETMIHPHAMEIFEYGGSLGLYQVVFTNGHFITAGIARRLADANVRCVLVSMHGDRETHNRLAGHKQAYDRAMHAMGLLRSAGINVVAELTLVADNVTGVLDVIRDVYSIGVREFGVMRYVPTGKNDEHYGVPVGVTMPLVRRIDQLTLSECPGMTVSWPCAQKLCASEDDAPLHADDPTLALRFSQIAGHCESGMVWASVSYDGHLRNCPHSNVYFGAVGAADGIGHHWPELTTAVHKAVAPRGSCSGCSVAEACRGGCHLGSFFKPPQSATMMGMPTIRAGAS